MKSENFFDLIIVGGGPAGITAGIYAARKKIKTLIIAKNFRGQVQWAVSVENYPGFEPIKGLELAKKFENHLRRQDITISEDEVEKIKKENQLFGIVTKDKKEYMAYSVIIASGCDPRPLEVPGEKEFIEKGLSYCTTCDAPFFDDKIVAVIGGGNSGVRSAIELTNYAKKVYLLEFMPQLAADEIEQQKAKTNDKITIICSSALKKIEGGNMIERIIYEDRKSKNKKTLKVDGVFVSVGTQPVTAFVKGLVEFNKRDEIMIDSKTCETKTKGLFAAGDATDVLFNQIIIATGEGAKAALSAHDYIRDLKTKDE